MSREQPPRGRLGELEVREGQPFPLARPLDEALRGAVFPLSPEQLVHVARENEASGLVLSLLSALPRQQFISLDAVTHALDEGAPQVRHFHPPSGPLTQR